MTILLERRLEEAFDDLTLRQSKGYLVSWSTLSEIYHVITYCNTSEPLKNTWLKKVSSLDLAPNVIEAATKEAIEKFKRVQRIISHRSYLNDDEWLLVLMLRLELEMLKDFFKYKKIDFPPLALASLCEKMKELSQTKKNKKDFDFSVSQMKKNSPLPFVDIWFQAEDAKMK